MARLPLEGILQTKLWTKMKGDAKGEADGAPRREGGLDRCLLSSL